jgi:hypothetical protein
MAAASVVCLGSLALWPRVADLCEAEIASFVSKNEDGWPEVKQCLGHCTLWLHENLGGVVPRVVMAANAVLVIMVHLVDVMVGTLLWMVAQFSLALRLAAHFLTAMAEASAAIHAALSVDVANWARGLAHGVVLSGTSASMFVIEQTHTASIVVRAVVDCALNECALTAPSFDEGMKPRALIVTRQMLLQMSSFWDLLQQPDLAYKAFRFVVLARILHVSSVAGLGVLRFLRGALIRGLYAHAHCQPEPQESEVLGTGCDNVGDAEAVPDALVKEPGMVSFHDETWAPHSGDMTLLSQAPTALERSYTAKPCDEPWLGDLSTSSSLLTSPCQNLTEEDGDEKENDGKEKTLVQDEFCAPDGGGLAGGRLGREFMDSEACIPSSYISHSFVDIFIVALSCAAHIQCANFVT